MKFHVMTSAVALLLVSTATLAQDSKTPQGSSTNKEQQASQANPFSTFNRFVYLRLKTTLVASADKAREMGIDWWEGDPFLRRGQKDGELEHRLKRLERAAGIDGDSRSDDTD